jgi:hypothetical protein
MTHLSGKKLLHKFDDTPVSIDARFQKGFA